MNRMKTWQKGNDDDGSRSISASQGATSVVTAEQQRHVRSCTTARMTSKQAVASKAVDIGYVSDPITASAGPDERQ
jgi:hypothetical protein